MLQRVVAAAAPGAARRGHDHRRVVDEDVDPAERGDGVVGEAAHGIRVGEVGGEDRVARAGQPGRHRLGPLERVGGAVVDHDPVAVRGEGRGHGGADTARGPVTRTPREVGAGSVMAPP